MRPPRNLATGIALATTGLAGLAVFVVPGFLFHSMRCDDSCSAPPYANGWTYDSHAWQWDAQFWGMAVPGVCAALLVVCFLAMRRPRAATVARIFSAAAYAAWAAFYVEGRPGAGVSLPDVISHPWIWLPYTIMVLGGAIAIRIQRRVGPNRTDRAMRAPSGQWIH